MGPGLGREGYLKPWETVDGLEGQGQSGDLGGGGEQGTVYQSGDGGC